MSKKNGNGGSRPQIKITVLGDADVQLIGQRFIATAKYWKGTHCHGFCPDTGGDVYVWWEDIKMEGRKKLEPGQDFEFTLGQDELGPRAYNIKPLHTYWTHWSEEQWEQVQEE